MKKIKFESLNKEKLKLIEIGKIRRVLGGVNLPTYTMSPDENSQWIDGTWSFDFGGLC